MHLRMIVGRKAIIFHKFITFAGRNFRVQKKHEIYGINFRVSRFLKEISRKKLSQIEEKVYFRVKKTFAIEHKIRFFFQFCHFS